MAEADSTASTVNNGVNVAALISAREALTNAPQAAQFKWRAACEWKNGTHSHSTVEGYYGLGQEQHHKRTFTSTPIIRKFSPPKITARRPSSTCLSGWRAASPLA